MNKTIHIIGNQYEMHTSKLDPKKIEEFEKKIKLSMIGKIKYTQKEMDQMDQMGKKYNKYITL